MGKIINIIKANQLLLFFRWKNFMDFFVRVFSKIKNKIRHFNFNWTTVNRKLKLFQKDLQEIKQLINLISLNNSRNNMEVDLEEIKKLERLSPHVRSIYMQLKKNQLLRTNGCIIKNDHLANKIWKYLGSNFQLMTQVGKRYKDEIITTGIGGYLFYGPYVALKAGKYRIVVRGDVGSSRGGNAKIDVVTNKGERLLVDLPISSPKKDIIFDQSITLNDSCEDLEVRCLVDNNTELTIFSLEISKESFSD